MGQVAWRGQALQWSRLREACGVMSPNASVYDGGDQVSPGSPGQTAVRRTEWFGGGPSRHWLGDARGAGGDTAKEATIRETVQGSYGNAGLAAWEVAETQGPPVALRGPTVARGSKGPRMRLSERLCWKCASMVTRPSNACVSDRRQREPVSRGKTSVEAASCSLDAMVRQATSGFHSMHRMLCAPLANIGLRSAKG